MLSTRLTDAGKVAIVEQSEALEALTAHPAPRMAYLRDEAELRKAISFLDREFDETLLRQAVQFASFDNLARKEAAGFFNTKRMQPGDVSDPNTFKVRRGQVGGYRDYFSAKELEAIDALLQDALPPELGYSST